MGNLRSAVAAAAALLLFLTHGPLLQMDGRQRVVDEGGDNCEPPPVRFQQAAFPTLEDREMASFGETVRSIPGLVHYYALNDVHKAEDLVGSNDGTVHGNVTFGADGAHFDGKSWIDVGDADGFSVTTTKELTIVAEMTVDDWSAGSANGEYLHWMGKGSRGAHEWTWRTYVDGGSGEAPQRKRRISFYHFVPSGGLGTGSYVQDRNAAEGKSQMLVGQVTTKGSGRTPGYIALYCNGEQRDKDMLTAYRTVPENTSSHVCIGSRGDGTGALKGRIRRVAFFDRLLSQAEIQKLEDAKGLPEDAPEADEGGVPRETGQITIGGASHAVDGFDVERGADQLVIYTPDYGPSTGTNEWGAEAMVSGGRVTMFRDKSGDSPIPANGYVVSAHGTAREWLEGLSIEAGTPVSIPGEEPAPRPQPQPDPVPAPQDNSEAVKRLQQEAGRLRASAELLEEIAGTL